MSAVDTPNRDLATAHPLLQQRWAAMEMKLQANGIRVLVIEVWRSNLRQQWLFGAGRTAEELAKAGVSGAFARPQLAKVTNAWSAKTSAHGWTIGSRPASCAIDLDPVGADGKPYTADDPWDAFVAITEAAAAECGLRHFRDSNGRISDRPHLQLQEYSDLHHRLILSPTPGMPDAA